MSVALLQAYAQRIRELRRANPDAPETALAPAFQQLLEGLISLLAVPQGLVVVPEYRNPGVGRPDIALVRRGAPPRAFVELKAPAKSADPTRWRDPHDRRQFERFRELPSWATCNFAEVRLFERAEECGSAAVVPEPALRPDRDDARANRAIAGHDAAPLLRLIERLCAAAGQEPRARDAPHLALLMAHSARLVRGIVKDRLTELHTERNPRHALLQVRQEFRDVLYAHPEAAGYSAADFNELFSAAFAQTLAFGLLLVREATGRQVDRNAYEHMPAEHPLMRTALRVLTLPEVVQDVGIGFLVLCDTVNSFAPEILAPRPDGRDPILYFYEDFLEIFDPDARERYGVYYTPVAVVQYMVGALDRALREDLRTEGLRDPRVMILDPAAGTGTFLLGIAERVRDQAAAKAGEGMAALVLRDLAGRMFGFELLVGPYAVAHYRLHHALRRAGAPPGEPSELPRLGVYLADTLAEPGSAAPAGPLGFVSEGIADERREANRIKTTEPILAIIGNPPYRRLEEGENRTLVGNWLDHLWDDLKAPVRAAGQGNQLNTFPELSVAFWRWALWKLFEAENAPGRGVVALITNRKFLTGWPYAGLRRMLRERFDRIAIVDLRGDVRRGERGPMSRGIRVSSTSRSAPRSRVLPQFEIGSIPCVLRLLASLALRMRIFLNAIKNILMLRRPRSGRLEARTALMRFQIEALPDHACHCRRQQRGWKIGRGFLSRLLGGGPVLAAGKARLAEKRSRRGKAAEPGGRRARHVGGHAAAAVSERGMGQPRFLFCFSPQRS